MILVLAGTAEGREAIGALKAEGHTVWASTVSEYGGSLARGAGADRVLVGVLGRGELASLLRREEPLALVDATHPFAERASREAMAACNDTGVPYLRFERPAAVLPDGPPVTRVPGFVEAARAACAAGEVLFLSVGSRHLQLFVAEARKAGRRVVARVLPDPLVLERCRGLGLGPGEVVAARGPFSRELNAAMFRHYRASVLVTKESGPAGGTEEKILAALEVGIPVVVVERPKLAYPAVVRDLAGLLAAIKQVSPGGGGVAAPICLEGRAAPEEKATSGHTAVVVAAHGSRMMSADGNELDEICRLLRPQLPGMSVKCGSLQFNSPSLEEAVEEAIQEGADRVVVVPFFLFRGAHVVKDIPAMLRRVGEKHRGVEILLAPHLGPDPRLAEILRERAENTLVNASPGEAAKEAATS